MISRNDIYQGFYSYIYELCDIGVVNVLIYPFHLIAANDNIRN